MKSFFEFLNTCSTERTVFYLAALLIAFSVVIMSVCHTVTDVIKAITQVFRRSGSHNVKNDNTAAHEKQV
jgi:hypothetical protein